MADSVKIVFDAVDNATGTMAKIQMGFSTFNNVLYAAESIAQKVGEALDATVGEAVKYADQIRSLQIVSGQTAEETSRMIQVFDDFGVSAENLTPLIRRMTSEGLTPNMQTVAQLADEYNKLSSPLEKNAFLMDKFGRSGLEMAQLMSRGGDAIREMSSAVSENLIMNQEGVSAAEEYSIAVDNLSEAWLGMKIAIGEEAIPALTDSMNAMMDNARAMEIMEQAHGRAINTFELSNLTLAKEYDAALAAATAEREHATQLRKVAEEASGASGAIDILSMSMSELSSSQKLSFIMDFQAQADNLAEGKDKILSDMTELKDKIVALREEMAAGTADEGAPEDLAAMEEELRGLTGSLEEGKAAFQKWQKQAVFALLQTKMAADGLTDVEFEQLLQVGQDMGLLDPEVVQQAQDLMGAITGVDASSLGDAVNDVKYLVGQDGRTITIYVNQVETTTTTEGGTGTGTSGTGGQGAETNAAGTTTSGIPVVNLTFTMPGTYDDVLAFLRG